MSGVRHVILAFLTVALIGCGGGGSSSGEQVSQQPSSSSAHVVASSSSLNKSQSNFSVSSQGSSASGLNPIQLQPVTRENTPYLTAAVFNIFDFVVFLYQEQSALLADIELLSDGSFSMNCDSGKLTLIVEGAKSKITMNYDDCVQDGAFASGRWIIEILNSGVAEPFKVQWHWIDFKTYDLAWPDEYEQLNIDALYTGKVKASYDNDQQFTVSFNGQIYDSTQGSLEVEKASFSLGYSNFRDDSIIYKFGDGESYSGRINWVGKGAADFNYSNEKVFSLRGATAATGFATLADGLRLTWDEQNDGVPEAQLFYSGSEKTDLSEIIFNGSNKIELSGKNNEIFYSLPKYMSRGETYTVDIGDALTHTSLSLLDFDVKVDGRSDPNGDWTQPEAGKFVFSFPDNSEDQTYNLVFFAHDTSGKNTYEIPISFFVGSDFDQDGIPDRYDDDDDNDSVADVLDGYPLDNTESADTDNDGVADNQDSDADADGVPNFADANPLDGSNCLSQASCHAYSYSGPLFLDKNGVLYFEGYLSKLNVMESRTYVPRFDSNAGEFMTPLQMPQGTLGRMLYEAQGHKIYFDVNKKIIYTMDLLTQKSLSFFQSNEFFAIEYVEPNHIVIGRQVYNGSDGLYIESYNFNGGLISSMPANDRLYPVIPYKYATYCNSALTSGLSGNLFLYTNTMENTCSSYSVGARKISTDGSRIYRSDHPAGNGIYSMSDGSLLVSIPSFPRFYWVANGYVLHDPNVTPQKIELYDEAGSLIQSFSIPDTEFFLGLYTTDTRIVLRTSVSESGRNNIRTFDAALSLLNTHGY